MFEISRYWFCRILLSVCVSVFYLKQNVCCDTHSTFLGGMNQLTVSKTSFIVSDTIPFFSGRKCLTFIGSNQDIFSLFSIVSFYHKWNGANFLSPKTESQVVSQVAKRLSNDLIINFISKWDVGLIIRKNPGL